MLKHELSEGCFVFRLEPGKKTLLVNVMMAVLFCQCGSPCWASSVDVPTKVAFSQAGNEKPCQ